VTKSDSSVGVVYLGIDPGKKGALAAIYNEGQTVESWHVPMVSNEYNLRAMLQLLVKFQHLRKDGWRVETGIEEQNPRPTDSKHTAKMVGFSQGLWSMACAANSLPFQVISPRSWKPKYVAKGATKQESILAAITIYPEVELPLKKDEARAEAILIADYLMRMERKLNFPMRKIG